MLFINGTPAVGAPGTGGAWRGYESDGRTIPAGEVVSMSTTVKNDSFSSGGGGSALAIDYGRVNRYVVHATAGSPGNSMPGCSVANGGASFNYDYVSACPGLDDDFKGKSGTFYVNTSFVGSYSFSQAYIYSASCTLEYVG